MIEQSRNKKRTTDNSGSVVDISAAREQQKFMRKEQKLDAMRERFSRALGMDAKKPGAKLKRALQKKRQRK